MELKEELREEIDRHIRERIANTGNNNNQIIEQMQRLSDIENARYTNMKRNTK